MATARPSRYKVIRGLARGLNVLRALNERSPGGWSPAELAAYLEIHRTTLKRICETLRELQYVSMDVDTGRYCLAPAIRSLASGFRDDDALIVAARQMMPQLIEKLVWPVILSIPEKHAMVSRLENLHLSPLAFHRTTLGHCFPFHTTATGRAYIAACAPEQRRELLRSNCLPKMRSRAYVDLLERRIAARVIDRFGVNDNGWGAFKNFSAIALPIYVDHRLAGSLTMGFPRNAMSINQALDRFGDKIRSEVDRIGAIASSFAADNALSA
jgi:IclR family mhp operon transcriptional activator